MDAPAQTPLDRLFSQYEACHQHPTNVRIHAIAVPTILFCVLGFLWPLRIGHVNVGIIAAVSLLVYALRLHVRLALGLGLELMAMAGGLILLQNATGAYFSLVLLVMFSAAWGLQFAGHHIEGKKPAFFQDLLFLFVGPLWTLNLLLKARREPH